MKRHSHLAISHRAKHAPWKMSKVKRILGRASGNHRNRGWITWEMEMEFRWREYHVNGMLIYAIMLFHPTPYGEKVDFNVIYSVIERTQSGSCHMLSPGERVVKFEHFGRTCMDTCQIAPFTLDYFFSPRCVVITEDSGEKWKFIIEKQQKDEESGRECWGFGARIFVSRHEHSKSWRRRILRRNRKFIILLSFLSDFLRTPSNCVERIQVEGKGWRHCAYRCNWGAAEVFVIRGVCDFIVFWWCSNESIVTQTVRLEVLMNEWTKTSEGRPNKTSFAIKSLWELGTKIAPHSSWSFCLKLR